MKIIYWISAIIFTAVLIQAVLILSAKRYSTGRIWIILLVFRVLVSLGLGRIKLIRFFINLNNRMVKKFNKSGNNNVLILLPRCLQNQLCTQAVAESLANCKSCGKCDLAEIRKINYTECAKIRIATGGEIAVNFVFEEKPDLVIAVACERELFAGLSEIKGFPVFAVANSQPEGPCKNTRVDMGILREALSLAGI